MSAKKTQAGTDEDSILDSVEEALVGESQEVPGPDPDDERRDGGRDKPPLKSP